MTAQASRPVLSWRRKESVPPKAAVVTSAKTGADARLRWCSAAVHSRTRQAPSASRRQLMIQRPTHSARHHGRPRPTMS